MQPRTAGAARETAPGRAQNAAGALAVKKLKAMSTYLASETIPLSSPDIDQEDIDSVVSVLMDRALSLGPQLENFEEAVKRLTGAKHAVAVNSGTSGLHLSIKAAGIESGDEVITTPFSFVASANAILFERGVPVFVDIDPDTLNIDASQIEQVITPRTRAILPVHVFGLPCDMTEVVRIAGEHNLSVIEDACEAIGAGINGKMAGTFGDTGVFAFYPNKQMTTGEGGVVVTNNDVIAALCRSWRNQGRKADGGGWLQHERLGYNYRLSDINCALGVSQLKRLGQILRDRARVAAVYREYLAEVPELVLPPLPPPGVMMSWFVYVVRLHDDFTGRERNLVMEALRNAGIGCRSYFAPIHLQTHFREQFGFCEGRFPVTEHVAERTIALPFFNHLEDGDIAVVCDRLIKAIRSLPARGVAVPSAFYASGDREIRPPRDQGVAAAS